VQNRTTTGAELRTLIHELGHVFEAKDHYYSEEVATKDPNDNLHSTDTLKAMYPDLTFSSDCLYGENRNTSIVQNNMTMCSGCKHFIKEHAGMFN